MIRLVTAMLLGCCTLPVAAAEPGEYAWGWTLETRGEAPAWRIRLSPEIVELLTDDRARDLAVFDADRRAMPLLRVPAQRLVETVTSSRSLEFEAREHAAGETGQPEEAPAGLSLTLMQADGTRLELRAPSGRPGEGSDGDPDLLYEALVVSSGVVIPEDDSIDADRQSGRGNGGRPRADDGQRWLITRWVADRAPDAALNCILKSVDHPGRAGSALSIQPDFDTRPVRMRARTPVDAMPRGWHIACRGSGLPPGFQLLQARLETLRARDHNQVDRVRLAADPVGDGIHEGRAAHPYAPRRLRVTSPSPNQLSRLRLMLRTDADAEWRLHGEQEFSSLGEGAPGRVDFDLGRVDHRRFDWRIESRPPLAGPVDFELEVRLEEWLFLAQGKPPWQLSAGSRKAAVSDPHALAGSTLARLGKAWRLLVAVPGERFEAGGPVALESPPTPLPWRQYLLWLVLVAASLVVAWLAFGMLRVAR